MSQQFQFNAIEASRSYNAELEVLLLGGSTFDVPLVLETLEEGSESEEPNQRQGVDSGLGAFMSPMSPRHKSRGERLASTLKDALFTLSALKVLELTFFPTQAVRILATDLEGIEVGFPSSFQHYVIAFRDKLLT